MSCDVVAPPPLPHTLICPEALRTYKRVHVVMLVDPADGGSTLFSSLALQKRMVENSLSPMTALHRKLLHHLVSMSISTYPEVGV